MVRTAPRSALELADHLRRLGPSPTHAVDPGRGQQLVVVVEAEA